MVRVCESEVAFEGFGDRPDGCERYVLREVVFAEEKEAVGPQGEDSDVRRVSLLRADEELGRDIHAPVADGSLREGLREGLERRGGNMIFWREKGECGRMAGGGESSGARK